MGVASFTRNTVVEIEGTRYIMSRQLADGTWQLEDLRTKRVMEYNENRLYRLLINAQLTFITGPPLAPYQPRKITLSTEEELQISDRLKYVRAVINVPTTKEPMEEAILKVWEQLKRPEKAPSWTAVYRWKVRYLVSGEDADALLDQHGGRRQRDECYGQIVLTIVTAGIDEIYMQRPPGTKQDVLDHVQVKVAEEEKRLNEEQQRAGIAEKPIVLRPPGMRLIKRMIDEIPAFDRHAARHGRQAALMRFRSVLGHDIAELPLDIYEVDSSIFDCMVIDDEADNWVPLGRPNFTLAEDNCTRCVPGLYAGFAPISSFSVARCLEDAFLPKFWIHEQYPSIQNDVPWGVPRRLKLDQGLENHGEQLDRACYTLGIAIAYAPRRTPWWKGKIERVIGTLNREVAHRIPGTTFSNIFEKGDYNPTKTAIVRLSRLREGVRKWIADEYHQRPHRALDRVPPAEVWAKKIRPSEIRLPSDVKILHAVMGRPYERMLTHNGISFLGLTYNSQALTELRMRYGAELPVEIRVNEEDLGSIHVVWNNTEVFEAPSLEYEYASGVSVWQHELYSRRRREQKLSSGVPGYLVAKEQIRELMFEAVVGGRRPRKVGLLRDKGERHAKALPSHELSCSGSSPASGLESSPATVNVQPPTVPSAINVPKKHFTPIVRLPEGTVR